MHLTIYIPVALLALNTATRNQKNLTTHHLLYIYHLLYRTIFQTNHDSKTLYALSFYLPRFCGLDLESHHHAETPAHQIHHPQIHRTACKRGGKEREQQTCYYSRCYYSRCHRVLEFAAMSWIWPEEKKGGRLAVHLTGGEEGRPSVVDLVGGEERRPPLWPVVRILTGGQGSDQCLGAREPCLTCAAMAHPRSRATSTPEKGAREGELALGREEQGRRRRHQSSWRRSRGRMGDRCRWMVREPSVLFG